MFFRKGKKRMLSFSPPFFSSSKRAESTPAETKQVETQQPVAVVKQAAPLAAESPVGTPAPAIDANAAPQTDALKGVTARGHVDVFSASSIAGWVYYKDRTDLPVTLSFYFDGRLVGTSVADQLRPDVKKAGHETDRCGFNFTPPAEAYASVQKIEVRAANGQVIRTYARPAQAKPAQENHVKS